MNPTKALALPAWLIAVSTLAPLASATTADQCAGGSDAPGDLFTGWDVAHHLDPPVLCSGELGTIDISDYDWYSVTVPADPVTSGISVRVCGEADDRWGSIQYTLYASTIVDDALGLRPETVDYQFGLGNGECRTSVHSVTGVLGSHWYIQVNQASGACYPCTVLGYTLEVQTS